MPVIRTKDVSHQIAATSSDLVMEERICSINSKEKRTHNTSTQKRRYNPIGGRLHRPKSHSQEVEQQLLKSLEEADFSDLLAFGNLLARFVNELMDQGTESTEDLTIHYKIATIMSDFLDDQTERLEMCYSTSFFSTLLRIFESIPSNETLESILYVLAATFVLTGPLIFTRPNALELLARIFGAIPSRRSNTITTLRLLTWRCLVWSFHHMVDWGLIDDRMWEKAVQTVEPHLLADDVKELVAHLIDSRYPQQSDNCDFPGVRLAGMVLNALGNRYQAFPKDLASQILQHLLLGDTYISPIHPKLSLDAFAEMQEYLNGRPFSRHPRESISLRTLSIEEVNAEYESFIEPVLELLLQEVIKAVNNSAPIELSHRTMEAWRILLCAARHDPSTWESLAEVHIALIEAFTGQGEKSEQLRMREINIHAIQVAADLWTTTAEELGTHPRAAVAEMLLRKLFERQCSQNIGFKATQDTYNKFVSELVYCDPQRALRAMKIDGVNIDMRKTVQISTWCDIVACTVLQDVQARGGKSHFIVQDLICFLKYPYRMGLQLDHYASQLWYKLLSVTLSIVKVGKPTVLFCLFKELHRLPSTKIERQRREVHRMDPVYTTFGDKGAGKTKRRRKRVHK